ncbi:hypothetical protein [Streptomyces albipurpureus]|uniref:Uncharacterized protein n=1 Tax=Streptomyces albipurpureus TaxID=2897419 RepID=A0ABT0UNY8_9ACTN|nr:hypothetical protein [Streptomyces sp. CWNU-1]MCM2390179.1 hypothetical protein [Streptomyces sp. CWNU-1]
MSDLHESCATRGEHHLDWEQGNREVLPTTSSGWVQYEHDGTMRIRCCCSFDSEWGNRDDVIRLAREHLASPLTSGELHA